MRHLRSDWDSIQPAPGETTIEEDEPVFLLRARDVLAPNTVRVWARQAISAGDKELGDRVMAWADEMAEWGFQNGRHFPDTPEGKLR